jgi:flagellar basal body-associated protein FliL
MKQIIISIAILAVALALVIGVIVPIFAHGSETGSNAVFKGTTVQTGLEAIIK